jgi:hypothetical protein
MATCRPVDLNRSQARSYFAPLSRIRLVFRTKYSRTGQFEPTNLTEFCFWCQSGPSMPSLRASRKNTGFHGGRRRPQSSGNPVVAIRINVVQPEMLLVCSQLMWFHSHIMWFWKSSYSHLIRFQTRGCCRFEPIMFSVRYT